jgi:uncharacterized protein YhfF
MARADEVEAFWREFCRLHGVPTDARHDVFAFGDNPALIDELLALVLHGPKRATASLLTEFEAKGEPLPVVGGHSVVLDSDGRPRCVVRTSEVQIAPFSQVDEAFAFAFDEGEDDRTLESWREGHRRYFGRVCARLGRPFAEDLPVVLERFELVWAPPPHQGTENGGEAAP